MATKTKQIKAVLGFTKAPPEQLLARANAVHDGIAGNPADYTPPVDMAAFKGNIDVYASRITAAMDGSRKAIAERNHQGEVIIKALRQLAHYVELNCKDDLATFLRSGFQAASPATRTGQPLTQWFRKIDQGNSGQLLVTVAAVSGAFCYELRWAAVGAGGALGAWAFQTIGKSRPGTSISGLTPGVTYAFQVRSLTNAGYSDWSDSVTRMCT